jgi:hypothetical protein
MNAPRSVVLVIGSPKSVRPVKPVWKPKREPGPWRPAEDIPRRNYDELRRRVEEQHRTTKPQRDTLRAAGRALRVLAREQRTGVPFVPYEAA